MVNIALYTKTFIHQQVEQQENICRVHFLPSQQKHAYWHACEVFVRGVSLLTTGCRGDLSYRVVVLVLTWQHLSAA